METSAENVERLCSGGPSTKRTAEQHRRPERTLWPSAMKKLTFRRWRSARSGANPECSDQGTPVDNSAEAEAHSSKRLDTAGPNGAENARGIKHAGFSLFQGVTFRVVDENGKESGMPPSRICLPRPEAVDVRDTQLKEGTAKSKHRTWNNGTRLSFPLREFSVRGTNVSAAENRDGSNLYNSGVRGADSPKGGPKRLRLPPLFSSASPSGHGAGSKGASVQRETIAEQLVLGHHSFLLDVDAADELPPWEVVQIHKLNRPSGYLQRLYQRICKHPVYKFFPDEDQRYFDIMVTGIPVYFSSKKLERSFVLYSCPALSGYLIGFHSLFILCTVLQFILCFAVQPGFYEMWKLQLPFFFSWVISFGSIIVTLVWRVSGGRKAELFNRRENKLMKREELPAGMILQEAIHWRPCFTEDFAAVSFSLALGVPLVVSGGVIAYLYVSMKDDFTELQPGHKLPPIFSSPTGVFGFAASQAFLALAVLFLSSAVLVSGIRIRKLLFVCVALLTSTVFFHICCSLVFYERTLLLAGIMFTYSMIPVSIVTRMRTERLRRFLFLLHERSQYAQQDHFEDSAYGFRSSTPVEELIMLINEAGLKVRHARSKYKYKKSPDLLESEAMLLRCLMILTAGGDLFAFRMSEGGEEDEKEVRDDLLNIIGSSMREAYRARRRGAFQGPDAIRDVTCGPEDDDDQSQDRPAERAADAMTSFHADPMLDLWTIIDIASAPPRPVDPLASDGAPSPAARRDDPAERSPLLANLPIFPSPRIKVAYSRRVSIDWDLSMLEVEKECKGCCLYRVGCDLLFYKVHGFECSKEIIRNFLKVVQLCYQQTVYHNHLHGAQVAHNTVWLARRLNLISGLDAAELVGLIVAALCHDIGHQGKNNAYYVTSGASVSLIYNDTAVLENFHSCTTFKILARPECNIFGKLEHEAFRLLRTRIIDLILATDMKTHFESVSKFRLRRNAPDFALSAEDDRWMALRMCIKGGDLSHASLNWDSHVSWSYRATAEFYEQGDLELSEGRTIANMFDRRKHADFPKGQEAFLKYLVVPLYEEIAAADTSGEVQSECLKRISENREQWCHLQNNPADFAQVDDEQQRIINKLKEALQATAKTNTACTQAILRTAYRSCGEGSIKTGGGSVLGPTPQPAGPRGSVTTGMPPEAPTAEVGFEHDFLLTNHRSSKASQTPGQTKKKEVPRMVDVVTAVKGTVQSVAKHAAETAAKATRAGVTVIPGPLAPPDDRERSLSKDKSPHGNTETTVNGQQRVRGLLNIESSLNA